MNAAQLPQVAPAAQLAAWLDAAQPGARAIYCTAAALPQEADGVVAVRRWAAEGRVHLVQARDPAEPGQWRFIVEKSGAPPPAEPAPPLPPRHAVNRAQLRAMLDILRDCAARGRPCPSNRDLARKLRLPHRHRARYLFNRLLADGAIAVADRGRNAARIVTILAPGAARGKSTAAGEAGQ